MLRGKLEFLEGLEILDFLEILELVGRRSNYKPQSSIFVQANTKPSLLELC